MRAAPYWDAREQCAVELSDTSMKAPNRECCGRQVGAGLMEVGAIFGLVRASAMRVI